MCKLQDCVHESVSVRAMQCSTYDTIQSNGTQLAWIPVDVEDKPCELFCRRRDQALIKKKSVHVTNGTPCTRFSRDICIDGICQMVGCDNVVSSGAVEDRCGVCRGDGSSCLTIQDSFNTKYGRGYVEITVIPAGARNIVLDELVSSQNYLAISNASGHDLLNMDWYIDWSGEYQAAGTIISYERIDNKERVEILGPISEPLHIYLIFQRAQNPGITYKYTMPREGNQTAVMPQFFSWVFTDWSPCSASCGIGYQRSSVICKELIAGLVDDRYCEGMKPDDMQQTCNEQQCPATSWEGPWQHCTGSCGEEGHRQRCVFCIRGSTNGEQTVLDDVDCLSQGQEKPVTETTCEVDLHCESNDNWQTGEWSQCSVSCGGGWHTRSVICTNAIKPCDVAGKPSDRRPCFLDQCPRRQDLYNAVPEAPESRSYADESSLEHISISISERVPSIGFRYCYSSATSVSRAFVWVVKTTVAAGYVEITVIPAGARNIVLDELVSSQNYLAISNASGHDLLNMDWYIDWSGEYQAAGTIISYERIDNKERVEILGPISEPLHIYLIFQRAQNPGITYKYTMPREGNQTAVMPQFFSWVFTDWSPCSASCGIGYQRSSVICKELIAGLVDDRYCEGMKPDDMQQTCNEQQCPATWWEGPWQHCTGSCGEEGHRQRCVFCIRGSTNGEQTVLDDVDCLSQDQEKPVTKTTCAVDLHCESNDNWQTGEWSQESPATGDHASRRQDFYNAVPEAPESRSYADESSLDQSSASVSASSDYPANFGEWEKKIAIQKHESAANTTTKLHPPLPPEEAPHKPNYELNITTHDIDVIEKERKDSTINQLPVVPDSPYVNFILFPSALNDKHPSASDTATRLQHQSQEPSFGWSKQPWQPCSVTCGDGIQQRIVECVDRITGQRTPGCSQENQPVSLQSCNLGNCPQVCRNTLSTTMCLMIVQSGSCSQTHFRERCCRTCAEVR
eukprot:XP_011675289.1 PREDICTED: A disintegrin and metalloproteinase with thrombospondin motifs 7 [Strongylocentrotus purpuratus]